MKIHTFFAGSSLKCNQILFLAFLWINKVSWSSAQGMTGHSSGTTTKFYGYFRQLVASSMNTEECIIGGPGIEVEVDESKMGKRKYNRGHRVEGIWVVGGVERTMQRRAFLVPVERRNRETLTTILLRHIHPESIVLTDLWRGYTDVASQFAEHRTVNHSKFFKDPVTQVHTNTIEGTWSGLKARMRPRNRVRQGMEEHLFEFLWRRKHERDLWEGFMNALRDIHYDLV